MAEILVEFSRVIVADGVRYHAQACGAPMADGKWHGWLEFVPVAGGKAIRTRRETTQRNRTDAVYWATGLTRVYLEGALQRALSPVVVRHVDPHQPAYGEPAPTRQTIAPAPILEAVLDPFEIYGTAGEGTLRQQLTALAAWHLVNIVQRYELSKEPPAVLNRLPPAALIDRIVAAIRSETRTVRHARR